MTLVRVIEGWILVFVERDIINLKQLRKTSVQMLTRQTFKARAGESLQTTHHKGG